MKVHLIKAKTVQDFANANAASKVSFDRWLLFIRASDWESPEDILKGWKGADLLGNGTDRVVFDIGGNNYRIIAKYAFGVQAVRLFIKWIGTHGEYDKLCKSNRQYTIKSF